MKTAIIIHGAYGSPDENWFPWLKRELEKLRLRVIAPRFPTPSGQSLESWMKVLSEYEHYFDSDLILVGHSLGVALVLRKLERLREPINAAFLVAGFATKLGDERFDKINASFFEKPFDWAKIKKNCKRFYVFHSDNDPYVPLIRGKQLEYAFGVNMTLIPGAGHFNTESGYTQFPQLLAEIKKL
jgi:predicted alpha/beta hydrolase family esterase